MVSQRVPKSIKVGVLAAQILLEAALKLACISASKPKVVTSKFQTLDFFKCRTLRSFNRKLAVVLDPFEESHTEVKSRKGAIFDRSLATARSDRNRHERREQENLSSNCQLYVCARYPSTHTW